MPYLFEPFNKFAAMLSIYDAAPSCHVNRIRKLTKSIYNCELSNQEILDSIESNRATIPNDLPTQRDGLFLEFPDCWSILLLCKTQFRNFCKIWGDEVALNWQTAIRSACTQEELFWWLHDQLEKATNPIHLRQAIELDISYDFKLSGTQQFLKDTYGFELVYEMVLGATQVEWNQRSLTESGDKIRYIPIQYPLDTPERKEFIKAKQESECVARSLELFPTQESVIEYFARFWQEVYINRGEDYFQNLRYSLAGTPSQPLSQRSFYSATEHNFKHFLNNLNGFKKTTPWRIVKIQDYPLSWQHEGLLLRFDWKELQTLAVLGLLHPISQ